MLKLLCMMWVLVERWGPATGCGDCGLVHCGKTPVNLGRNSGREDGPFRQYRGEKGSEVMDGSEEGPFRHCMGEGGK